MLVLPSRIQCIKNFEGGGAKVQFLGWGLRSNFGAPSLYVYVLFWGLTGKRKAHKLKLFGPVGLGTAPGLSHGQARFVPGTNPALSLGQAPGFSLFSTVEARLVPGTNPVCPWDKPGVEGRQKKSLCVKRLRAFFARYCIFSKVLPVQMGGVPRYQQEAYCSRDWRCTAALQIGGALPVLFRQVVRVWGSSAQERAFRLPTP